ncbi:MAG TPA: hypothetical protein VK493_10460, partial [Bryobacteraceae bacterium]|nr:hypothetical protein [Bryobacteraceae bacterium]
MEKTCRVSRRTFLGGGGSALFLPSKVLGRNGFAPPSEKLNIGFIGVAGGFGRRALEELSTHNIVAVCDAAVICTPDHTHAIASITAMRM